MCEFSAALPALPYQRGLSKLDIHTILLTSSIHPIDDTTISQPVPTMDFRLGELELRSAHIVPYGILATNRFAINPFRGTL